MNRLLRLVTFALACTTLIGCHSARIREENYPAFYRQYESAPETLRFKLDESRRKFLDRDGEQQTLLAYARLSSELARYQVTRWLEAAAEEENRAPPPSKSLLLARRRALESADHAISLYRQYALSGRELDWKCKVEMSWLLAASGSDQTAAELLRQIEDNEIPAGEAAALKEMLTLIQRLGRKQP